MAIFLSPFNATKTIALTPIETLLSILFIPILLVMYFSLATRDRDSLFYYVQKNVQIEHL
jgi:predicted Na+-dependent transporter